MKNILLWFVIWLIVCWFFVFVLWIDTMFPRPIEIVEKNVYHDRYFYTWLNTEYKIWERWYVANKETMSYDSVVICWFVITNNDLEIWEYSYLVSKSSCYDTAETKNVFKYNFNKTLD